MEIGAILFVGFIVLIVLISLGAGAFVLLGSLHQSVNTPDPFKSARQELCAQLTLKPQENYGHLAGKRGKTHRSVRWVQQGESWQTLITTTAPQLSTPQAEIRDASQVAALGLPPEGQQALLEVLQLGEGEVLLEGASVTLRLQGEKLAQGFLQKRLIAMEALALALAA